MRQLLTRALRACLTAFAGLFLITCTDNPVGPGRPGLGSLRVAPTFDAFARNAPLTLDNVRVIVVRPPSDTLARVARSFSVSSGQLTLNIPLQLQGASEDLEVTLELYAGTTLLFSGTRIVRVSQGISPPPDSVPVAYQGPGATIAAIAIGPRDTTVVFGGSFLFGATASDSQQAPVASFYVGWTASAGTIDAAGQFTAPTVRDTVTVTATTPSGITDQTTVIVAAAPATLVKVGGDNQSGIIGSGLPQPLVVRVDGSDGLPVAGVPVTFAATTGGGSVDSATVVSDGAGLATMGATLGGTVGAQSFTATAPGLTAVVFAATGTSLSPIATWSGAVDTAWTTAGNWSTGAVPTATTDVVIPSGTPRAPYITNTPGTVRDLTVQAGAVLTMGPSILTVNGSLDVPGTISGNITAVRLVGTGTVRGNVTGSFFSLDVNGTYSLSGRLVASGITVNGTLTLNGFTALVGSSVGDDFQTSNNGRLVMTNALDSLIIGGVNSSILFDGASTAGSLTAGVILMNGSAFTGFTQDNTFNAASFAPSGTHKVVLATGATLSLSFSSPGTGSHFNILDISAQAAGFSLATPIVVNGLFVSTPSATAPAINGSNRLFTAAGGTQVSGLTLNNAQFAITGGAGTFDNVTFQTMNTAATQLSISGPGAATPLILNNLTFSTVPTTGFYLSATDTDGPTPNALAVSMVNPTPATPGAFTQVAGGATINWAPGAVKTWTGTTSTDWSVATNWSPSGVPIFSDDVTIPAAPPNQPTLGTTGNVRDLTVQTGATLTLNGTFTFNVNGDLDVSGTMALGSGTPTVVLAGATATFRGAVPTAVSVTGTYTVTGNSGVGGVLSVSGGTAGLTLGGFTLSATGLSIGSGGSLFMTNAAGLLDIAGNATFGGSDHSGKLTAGTLQVSGNFLQTSAGSPLSFAATGTHLTRLLGALGTVNFQSPGITASRFQDLEVDAVASISLLSRAMAGGGVITDGLLSLAGRTLEVTGGFTTRAAGTVTMTNALDSLLVGATATFNGGITTGLLTAGTLRVGGSITQGGSNAGAFDASGTHRTILTGTTPTVFFQGTGNTAGTSHFQEVTWAGGGTMTISTTTYALGQFTVSSAGTIAGQTFVQSLHVGQLANAAALTLFNTQLWIETTAAVPVALSNLTITVGSGVNQLYIRHPGLPAGGSLTLNQVTFTSTPSNPFVYLDVDDTNTGDGNSVIVDVSNSSPAASSLVLVANGAVVNWPAASPVKTWLGVTQDWHTTTNWSPAGLPTATDDVVIPVTANQPIMSAAGTARNLTVASGVLLSLNGFALNVNGDVAAPGATSFIGGGGTLVLAGTARSIGGTLSSALPVNVTGSYMLSSRTVIGDLTVSGTGDLAPIGNTLVVGAALNTVGSGTLTMTDPLDSVLVTGAGIFGGGFTGGKLTDGYLRIGGSFNQTSGTTAGSFAASGNHKTELGAAAVRVVTFASPGFGTGTSQFNHLDITGATGGLTLNSNVAVLGTIISAPSAGTPLLTGGGGQILTVQGGTQVTGLVVSGVPLVLDLTNGGALQFDGVTLQSMPVTAIQLSVTHPGAPSPFALNNLIFSTVPSSGLYLQATDADGGAPDLFTLDLVTPTPGTDGGFSQALGGAVINWPAAGPVISWTGAVSSDWFTAGNWSGGAVPTSSDSAVIVSAASTPTLTGLVIVGALEIQSGTLILGGQALGVVGTFRTSGTGTLTMTNPGDSLDIAGDAIFGGGDASALISTGVIQVGGNFVQGGTAAAPAFVGSGTNVVRLVGGTTALSSVGSNLTTVFNTLELATSGPVTLASGGLNLDGTGLLRVLTPVAVTYTSPGLGAVSFSGGTSTVAGSSMAGPFVSLFPGSSIQGTWTVDTTGWSQGAALQLQVPNTLNYNHLVLQQGNNFFFDPGTFTIPGSLITRVVNAGTIRVRDTLGNRTLLSVGGLTQVFGRLTPDGGKLTTAALDVPTLGGSRGFLVMQGAADSVIVSGNAAFGGGSTVGLLTAGTLQIQGDFSQTAATSVASFAPSGSHRTLLGASTARTATFASPGAGAAGSHFQVLDMTAASGGLTLASNAIVDSAFVVGVAAGAPKLVGGGNSLTARQWLVQGMDVDNAPMILNEQGTIFGHTFNNVSFAGFPTGTTSVALMDVTAVGSAAANRPIVFNNPTVQTSLGAGGLYARLTSSNGSGVTLTINGSNDPTGGPSRSDPPFGTTVAGARILWQ